MDRTLDLAIVGAGIAGVVALHYAKQAGIDALAFERQAGLGGLWRRLPAWQDIQISPQDWSLGDRIAAGPSQPDILANIEDWAARSGVAGQVRLSTPVVRALHEDGAWTLATPGGDFRARHLLVTGGHERPIVPQIRRDASGLAELHSSEVRDPEMLRGRDVVVVGGGASAYDLLDLSLAHGARRITWVHRGLRWFIPTRKPKHVAGSVRDYARMQVSGRSEAELGAMIGADLRGRYAKFGLDEIVPSVPFDIGRDQLMPGRALMIERFAEIDRRSGAVQAVEGRDVLLEDGQRIPADLLLWGTGYAADLSWLEVPGVREAQSPHELAARCGGIFRSLDAPDLYFPGVQLDGIGAAPFAYALMARTLISHIRGRARLDMARVDHHVNHIDLLAYLAERDAESFGADWRRTWHAVVGSTPDDQPYPLP